MSIGNQLKVSQPSVIIDDLKGGTLLRIYNYAVVHHQSYERELEKESSRFRHDATYLHWLRLRLR
jgi:hypothetical protein